jgi:hypothetical protein
MIIEKNLEMNLMYLGNKEIYSIFLDMLHNLFHFSQNAISFIILLFCVQIILFHKPYAKIKNLPWYDTG